MLGAFKRNYDCAWYYVYTFKWKINENGSQLSKKKTRLFRGGSGQSSLMCHDRVILESWWLENWVNIKPIKRFLHTTWNQLVEEHIAVENFGRSTRIFSWWWYLLLAGISYKMKKIPPHISIPKSWLLSRDPIFSNLFPPHPSFAYTPRHCIYWNTTLIRTKTVFFLSLFVSTWQGPLCKIMKYFQLTPHSFHWILL